MDKPVQPRFLGGSHDGEEVPNVYWGLTRENIVRVAKHAPPLELLPVDDSLLGSEVRNEIKSIEEYHRYEIRTSNGERYFVYCFLREI